MFPRRFGHAPGTGVVALAILIAAGATARAEESPLSVPDREDTVLVLHPPGVNSVVQMAAVEADRRLGSAECREIYSDFRDAAGHTLQENLDSIGRTGRSYFRWIWFVNADAQQRCSQTDVLAFTTPGSRVVAYCGDRFTRQLGTRRLGLLATILIHEELHSLGLGENPPSSEEITRRVESRCGS